MASAEDREAARELAGLAMSRVVRVSGREPVRAVLRRLTRGRLGRRHHRAVARPAGTVWLDTVSPLRSGWRQRAAYLDGKEVFAVDYQTCRRCGLGWVEEPSTVRDFERCGLAAAGLEAVRAEHPDLGWHTLGGHFREAEPFWQAAGTGVPGGYGKRGVCPHRDNG
jgi:hypothetical protein